MISCLSLLYSLCFVFCKCPVLYQGDDNDDKDDDIEEEENGNGDVEVEHVGEIVPVDRQLGKSCVLSTNRGSRFPASLASRSKSGLGNLTSTCTASTFEDPCLDSGQSFCIYQG